MKIIELADDPTWSDVIDAIEAVRTWLLFQVEAGTIQPYEEQYLLLALGNLAAAKAHATIASYYQMRKE